MFPQVVVKTSNVVISRCYFGEDGTELFLSACCTCGTLTFPRSTNEILNSWRWRCRWRHWCSSHQITSLHVLEPLLNHTSWRKKPMKKIHLNNYDLSEPFCFSSPARTDKNLTNFLLAGQSAHAKSTLLSRGRAE